MAINLMSGHVFDEVALGNLLLTDTAHVVVVNLTIMLEHVVPAVGHKVTPPAGTLELALMVKPMYMFV